MDLKLATYSRMHLKEWVKFEGKLLLLKPKWEYTLKDRKVILKV